MTHNDLGVGKETPTQPLSELDIALRLQIRAERLIKLFDLRADGKTVPEVVIDKERELIDKAVLLWARSRLLGS